ncbi:variant erythrocyte surface antigen-1 family protein [Babesia divergens]|uniref:Variant erythrocyte surface antigen-1 family protein n=1 Tax=Babesia divergens TaxID=32595 RepID=A0AAD9GBH8_BABDI|nr:variant erythrocyte surface antigen-1 family protein [Babesia divergens]
MCIGGEALPSSLSVLRTLRSVLTGSLEPLGRIMVCYMYYTDVFVGADNIDNLKDALEAELKGSGLNDDLTQLEPLASGLEKFIGYSNGGSVTGKGIGKKGTGGGSYASSYPHSSVKWPECNSSSKCSSCSSSSCHSGSSLSPCHGSCCADCDVRKAAKIFLGFLPALYYALKYLYDKCKKDWNGQTIEGEKISNNSLRHFLRGMGYNVDKELNGTKKGQEISGLLSSLFNNGSSNGSEFKDLYEKSKEYFTSSSSSLVPSSTSKSKPETVREILLWLSGLPFTPGFEALLDHCKGLCLATKDSVNFNNFEAYLYSSCLRSPFVLATIQWPGKSEIFYHNLSDISESLYPEDAFDLFNMLLENVRKVFPALTFLKSQCDRVTAQAGWKDCYYGKKCAEKFKENSSGSSLSPAPPGSCCSGSKSAPSYGILCTSKPNVSNCHEHCIKPGVKCIGLQKCTDTSQSSNEKAHTSNNDWCNPCPHPLMAFICDSDPKNFKTLFKFPQGSYVIRMGFKAEHLPENARKGKDLHDVLKDFCDSSSTSLTSLVKFLNCISRTPPETLGEFFAFFKIFVPQLKKKFQNFDPYVKGEPGGPSANGIMDALETLNGSNSHSSGDHSVASLYSLNGCHVPTSISTCGKYLHPLTENAYNIFITDFVDTYLSWVCHVPRMFREKVEEFQGKFSDCCSKSSCKSIIYCPCAWPLISSQGFNFMSLSTLACVNKDGKEHGKRGNQVQKHDNEGDPKCTRKTCQNFISQLGKVVGQGSPLQALLDAIDKFLWSIRKPFFLFVLAFWAFVISYFLYVQLYKLDLLHLKSHAHLPRSFKILPSTLFSDASSKLKDLSYFTL